MTSARAVGAELVWADARESALGFYEGCGAIVGGDSCLLGQVRA